jgi:hypothetical protein
MVWAVSFVRLKGGAINVLRGEHGGRTGTIDNR